MKMPNYQTLLLLAVSVLIGINAVVSVEGFKTIERHNKLRMEYSRLRSGILYTNLRIRDAALSTDKTALEDEVGKINPVRKESLDALDFFRREQHTFPPEQRALTSKILIDRMEYRNIQNKLLTLIRDKEFYDANGEAYKRERWKLLQQYNLLMVEYIDKCDALISLSNIATHKAQERAKSYCIVTAGLSVLLVAIIIFGRYLWRQRH